MVSTQSEKKSDIGRRRRTNTMSLCVHVRVCVRARAPACVRVGVIGAVGNLGSSLSRPVTLSVVGWWSGALRQTGLLWPVR